MIGNEQTNRREEEVEKNARNKNIFYHFFRRWYFRFQFRYHQFFFCLMCACWACLVSKCVTNDWLNASHIRLRLCVVVYLYQPNARVIDGWQCTYGETKYFNGFGRTVYVLAVVVVVLVVLLLQLWIFGSLQYRNKLVSILKSCASMSTIFTCTTIRIGIS